MKKRSPASLMKRRIAIESATETADGNGGFTTSWSNFATLWASVEPIRTTIYGKEIFSSGQIQAQQMMRFSIRYMSGILPAMRITCDGRVFNIRSVTDPEGTLATLEILAEEGVAS